MKRLLNPQVAAGLSLAVLVVVFAVRYKLAWDIDYQAGRCERKIERSCDPEVLRLWATNLIATWDENSTNRAPCPPGLEKVHRYHPAVYVRTTRETEVPHVYLFWGGGALGHWGMYIGPPTFVPPGADKMRQWRPGMYFWRQP